MRCQRCGREIRDGDLVCGFCGMAVPRENLSPQTVQRIAEQRNSDPSLKPNRLAGVRIFGIALMIVGGLCDLICIALVGSGSLESFTFFTIAGTVCFFLGLVLTFAFRI